MIESLMGNFCPILICVKPRYGLVPKSIDFQQDNPDPSPPLLRYPLLYIPALTIAIKIIYPLLSS